MTRILWGMIKEQLILPFVDLKTEYYDLGLLHRNETEDRVTVEAANATRRLGVAVKCATITPQQAAHGGVPPADSNVEEPQRHHPLHPGRHGVSCPHPHRHHSPCGEELEKSPSPSPGTPTGMCIRAWICIPPSPASVP